MCEISEILRRVDVSGVTSPASKKHADYKFFFFLKSTESIKKHQQNL